MTFNQWAVEWWPTEFGRDELYHVVDHKLKLAGPGLPTARTARRSAKLLILPWVSAANERRWQRRYNENFGEQHASKSSNRGQLR